MNKLPPTGDKSPAGRSAPSPRNFGSNLRLGYLNSVFLLGRLTADADLRYTPKGTPVCEFRVAVNRRYPKKETGEWQEEAYYFPIIIWGQLAERLSERLKKGTAVLIQGELRSRDRETPTGEKRFFLEIFGRSVQILEKTAAFDTPEPEPDIIPPDEEPDIPKDQLDDIPF